MLQNAVNGIEELRQVKVTAEMIKVNSGKHITYDQYVNLLQSAAVAYDNQFKAKRNKRQVFQHEIIEDDDEAYEDANEYDIDTSNDVIQAFASASNYHQKQSARPNQQQRVRMACDKWFSLDQKQKEIWDQLDEKAKSIILGYSKPPDKPFSKKSFNKSSFPRKQQVNLHEISAYDFIQANMHDLHVDEETEDDVADDQPYDDN